MTQSHISPSQMRGVRYLKVFGPEKKDKLVSSTFPGARWSEPEECWVIRTEHLAHNQAAALAGKTYAFGRSNGASFAVEK